MKTENALKNKIQNAKSVQEAILKCTKCEKEYIMTIGEISWYYEVGNIIPNLCKECREEKKKLFENKKKENSVQKENV